MKRVLLIFAILLSGQLLYAQSVKEIEHRILWYLQKLNQFDGANIPYANQKDSLWVFNTSLFNYLLKTCVDNPASLEYDFKSLKGHRYFNLRR